jgi:hypothetical protein
VNLTGSGQHLIGSRSYANVFREVGPANDFSSVHQELSRSRDVVTVGTASGMQQVVAADHDRVGIGEDGERVARFVAEVLRDRRRIHADRDRTNSCRFEFRQSFFYAS